MFAERSKFSQLLNISHAARASGHRYRVNGITAHPVLPLLLTTSHHNIVGDGGEGEKKKGGKRKVGRGGKGKEEVVFCSELILWRVDPIGPLSKSGGISELARINSNEISAFSDVAWIPTLLPRLKKKKRKTHPAIYFFFSSQTVSRFEPFTFPHFSTTLGSISNSPSACFVASDGNCLRVYQVWVPCSSGVVVFFLGGTHCKFAHCIGQAVIDARALLAELNQAARRGAKGGAAGSAASLSSGHSSNAAEAAAAEAAEAAAGNLGDRFRVVSSQSTARPGAIIQLEAISDATQNWQSTLMLHAFQVTRVWKKKKKRKKKGLLSGSPHRPDQTYSSVHIMHFSTYE